MADLNLFLTAKDRIAEADVEVKAQVIALARAPLPLGATG